MTTLSESWLYKNDTRKYPLVDEAVAASNGIVDLSISFPDIIIGGRVYVDQLVVSPNVAVVSVSIENPHGPGTSAVLASAQVQFPVPFRLYPLVASDSRVFGFVIFGSACLPNRAAIAETHTASTGTVLESLVMRYPSVTAMAFQVGDDVLTGETLFEGAGGFVATLESIWFKHRPDGSSGTAVAMVLSLAPQIPVMLSPIAECDMPTEAGTRSDLTTSINGVVPDTNGNINLTFAPGYDFAYNLDGTVVLDAQGNPVYGTNALASMVAGPLGELTFVDSFDSSVFCGNKRQSFLPIPSGSQCNNCTTPGDGGGGTGLDQADGIPVAFAGASINGSELTIFWGFSAQGTPVAGTDPLGLKVSLVDAPLGRPPVNVVGLKYITGTPPRLPGDLTPGTLIPNPPGTQGSPVYSVYALDRAVMPGEQFTISGVFSVVKNTPPIAPIGYPVYHSAPFTDTCVRIVGGEASSDSLLPSLTSMSSSSRSSKSMSSQSSGLGLSSSSSHSSASFSSGSEQSSSHSSSSSHTSGSSQSQPDEIFFRPRINFLPNLRWYFPLDRMLEVSGYNEFDSVALTGRTSARMTAAVSSGVAVLAVGYYDWAWRGASFRLDVDGSGGAIGNFPGGVWTATFGGRYRCPVGGTITVMNRAGTGTLEIQCVAGVIYAYGNANGTDWVSASPTAIGTYPNDGQTHLIAVTVTNDTNGTPTLGGLITVSVDGVWQTPVQGSPGTYFTNDQRFCLVGDAGGQSAISDLFFCDADATGNIGPLLNESIPGFLLGAGSLGTIYHSTDGITWPSASLASGHSPANFNAMTYSRTLGLWFYLLQTGEAAASASSGATWVATASLPGANCGPVLALRSGRLFVIRNTATPSFYTSDDAGATWVLRGSSPVAAHGIDTAATDGYKIGITINDGVSNLVYASVDGGITFTLASTIAVTAVTLTAMTFANGLWVVVGNNSGPYLEASPDLVFWTLYTGPAWTSGINGIAGGNGRWVISGGSGDFANIGWTTDLRHWDTTSLYPGGSAGAISFAAGKFVVATNNNGSSTVYVIDNDGAITSHVVGAGLADGGPAGYGGWAGTGV